VQNTKFLLVNSETKTIENKTKHPSKHSKSISNQPRQNISIDYLNPYYKNFYSPKKEQISYQEGMNIYSN